MLLAIDIGNTTIAFAAMRNGKVKAVERIDTKVAATFVEEGSSYLVLALRKVLKRFRKKGYVFKMAVICSVVPKALKEMERTLIKSMGFAPQVVGRDIVVPIKNRYKNPKQVGQDRLVGAYAALHLYGSTRPSGLLTTGGSTGSTGSPQRSSPQGGKPLIVIDLGTATTFDVVSPKGEYLGGAIVPGLRLSAESLFAKTALLPKIDIRAPKDPIGRTTQESILSGLFYGYGSLCRGFIDLVSKRIKAHPKVVMTGGHTRIMKKFIAPNIRIIDEDLVFKGMALLAAS